jgi:hypothetical protein
MNRARISRLESALAPEPPCILGATLDSRTGQLRHVLYNGQGNRDAPPGLTLADLPSDCLIYRYDPSSECACLFQSTTDGRAHVQRVLGVNEDVVLGRDMERRRQ